MMQYGEDENRSLLAQLSTNNNHDDMNQLDSSHSLVLKQQRKAVCNLPASVGD